MLSFIDVVKSNPTSLLTNDFLSSNDLLDLIQTHLNDVIDLNKSYNTSKLPIDEIVIDELDANQVWHQAKIVLDSIEPNLLKEIKNHTITNEPGVDEESEESDESSDESTDTKEEEIDEDYAVDDSLDEFNTSPKQDSQSQLEVSDYEKISNVINDTSQEAYSKPTDKYHLNDTFFDLEEFNRETLLAEMNRDANDSEDDIDYFGEIPSDDEEEALYYDDFFDKPGVAGTKPNTHLDEYHLDRNSVHDREEIDYDEIINNSKKDLFAEDDENMSDVGFEKSQISTHERQQIEIQRQIAQLEDEAVAEKKWALRGEIKAKDRPDDALLTEDLEFDRTSKPVPVITSEITETLEDMIRNRIQTGNFDDLQKKLITDFANVGAKERVEISDIKSSKSLAELYEDDYKGVSQDNVVSEELQKSQDEISDLFKHLMYKLDALSSAHFVPKPTQKLLEIKVQSATISMEDAQPLTMSSATTFAPQEIYKVGKPLDNTKIALKNGVVMSKDELTKEERNRLRRAIKRKKSKTIISKDLSRKKSKTNDVIGTLSKAKNITIIDERGDKRDVKGNIKKTNKKGITGLKL